MNDLKFAVRQLLKNPGVTGVAAVSLALGIGLNSAVFSIINTVFFQTIRGVDQPTRVILGNQSISYPAYLELRSQNRSLSGLAASSKTSVMIKVGDLPTRRGLPNLVSDNYFATLGVQPLLGRFFESRNTLLPSDLPEAVLDYHYWQQHLGANPSSVGQAVMLNGHAFTIVGVAPEAFHGPGPERPPMWVPLGTLPLLQGSPVDWEGVDANRYAVVGRLRPEFNCEMAEAEAAVILGRKQNLSLDKPLVFGKGREVWTGEPSIEKRAEFLLVTVVPLVVASAILWIACSNVANLLLARAVARRREIALRLATGATRWRVVRLLLLESLLLAIVGGGLGLVVSQWTIDFVFATFSEFGSLAVSIDSRVMAYTAAVSILSTLLFGLLPALQTTRVDVAAGLRGEGSLDVLVRGKSKLRSFFLITQIAGSMALLVITATFVKSLVENRYGNAASARDHMLLAQLPETASALPPVELERLFRETIMAEPGVLIVSLLNSTQGQAMQVGFPGSTVQTNSPWVSVLDVDTAFFEMIGARFLSGRTFGAIATTDATAPDSSAASTTRLSAEAVINEAAARRLWNDKNILDRSFSVNVDTELRVVGVVHDNTSDTRVYRLRSVNVAPTLALLLVEPHAESMVAPLRQRLQNLASPRSFTEISTLRDAQSHGLTQITKVASLIGGMALCLAGAGLYGSIAFFAGQRMREMGVRLALGATRRQIAGMLVGYGFRTVAAGCTGGLVLVWIAFQFMNGLIFGQWHLDGITLALVIGVFTSVTLLASWLPARRAAHVDPMITLRMD